MENNINISEYKNYQTEEYLLKYLNNQLSDKENKIIELLLQNDKSFSDMFDGLLMLEQPEKIIENKEQLNKKIDTFTKNIKKQQNYKSQKIRQIIVFFLVISASVLSALIIYKFVKIKELQEVQFDKNGHIISNNYNDILYMSKNKYYMNDIVVVPKSEIFIEKYIVVDVKSEKQVNSGEKNLKKNSNYDFFDVEFYCETNKNFVPASFINSDSIFFCDLRSKLSEFPRIKKMIVIFSISQEGGVENIEFFENNNTKYTKALITIFNSYDKWSPAKLDGNAVKSRIAFFVD